jgi:hypothetical protein
MKTAQRLLGDCSSKDAYSTPQVSLLGVKRYRDITHGAKVRRCSFEGLSIPTGRSLNDSWRKTEAVQLRGMYLPIKPRREETVYDKNPATMMDVQRGVCKTHVQRRRVNNANN